MATREDLGETIKAFVTVLDEETRKACKAETVAQLGPEKQVEMLKMILQIHKSVRIFGLKRVELNGKIGMIFPDENAGSKDRVAVALAEPRRVAEWRRISVKVSNLRPVTLTQVEDAALGKYANELRKQEPSPVVT